MNEIKVKYIRNGAITILCVLILVLLIYNLIIGWIPNLKISSNHWYDTASGEEKRIVAEKVLNYSWRRNYHDALVFLVRHGNINSVPCLIEALKLYENDDMCFKEHCVEALTKITGKDYKDNYNNWGKWYNTRDR